MNILFTFRNTYLKIKDFTMYKIYKMKYALYISLLPLVISKGFLACPSNCPPCMKCNPLKGLCIAPRDFVSCNGGTGMCYAGTCVANLVLTPPITKALSVCQTYKCDKTGACNFANKPDGTDCTTAKDLAAIKFTPSVCIKGTCQKVVLGLTDIPPFRNIGCLGLANGTACDTNDVLGDGETCVNGVCKFPDGSFYGLLP